MRLNYIKKYLFDHILFFTICLQLAIVLFIIALKIKIKIARHVIHLREIGNIEVPRSLGEEMGYTFKITGLSKSTCLIY